MNSKAFKLDLLGSASSWLRRAARDERGGFALWFAAIVPAVSALAVGAVELQTLTADRMVMQDAADAAALAGAKELAVGRTGVTERAEEMAEKQLALLSRRYKSMDVTATLGGTGKSIVVMIAANRLSFFGNLVPPGGFKTLVTASAGTMNQQQVCVLTTDAAAGHISVQGSSTINAAGCVVHAASNLTVDRGAGVTALVAQAVGSATGPMAPAGRSGAEVVPDPFSSRTFPKMPCTAADFVIARDKDNNPLIDPISGDFIPKAFKAAEVWAPGVYCGMFQIEDGGDITLSGDDYHFVGVDGDPLRQGKLSMKGSSSKLKSDPVGSGVTLIFAKTSKLYVAGDGPRLSLKAQRAGANAGMLIVAPKDNTKQFTLQSPAVEVLEGVIYMPSAELVVAGDKVGNLSKWTIMITKALTLNKAASLMIKSDYAGSSVPVPAGMKASGSNEVRLFGSH